jgi:hypothetical protein
MLRIEVSSVEEAVVLANRYKAEGRHDWFRGQVRELPPRSSLVRIQHDVDALEACRHRVRTFCHWAWEIDYLTPLLEEDKLHKLFAILQHYGLPTHYLDFSTFPEVAGFFACDTAHPPTEEMSCIYCVNTSDLINRWEAIRHNPGKKESILETIVVDVSNLWRLQAQEGVFLHVNFDWDSFYPVDRIVFPYRGYPARPPREMIYPTHRSWLEQLLDHYFSYERGELTEKRLIEFIADLRAKGRSFAAVYTMDTWDRGLYAAAFINKATAVEHLASWDKAALASWHAIPDERFHETVGRSHQMTFPSGKSAHESGEDIRRQVLHSLGSLRSQALNFSFDGPPEPIGKLSAMLERAWNGMRILPYSLEEIAECLGRVTMLCMLGFADMSVEERRRCMEENFGPPQRTQFGTDDGVGSMAWATKAALANALRSDIRSLLTAEYLTRADDISDLFQVIHNPKIMFEFEPFKRTFAREIIPSQVLDLRRLILFNPALLNSFGNP